MNSGCSLIYCSNLSAYLDSLKKYDNDEDFKMVINDVTYLDKESAGTIL